jgi:PAS domain S-box-containing protein
MDDASKNKRQLISELAALRRHLTELESNDIHDLLVSIVAGSEDAIIGKDLDGNIRSWNKGAERIYGYSEEEVKGRHISILTPKDHVDEITKILERIKRGERVSHYETTRIRKDGTPLAVSLAVSPIRDATGSITGISTIARDISEQKRTEEALRIAGVYNRNLIEASLDPLVTINPDGKISDVNATTELVTGYSREELIGTDFSNYFTEPDLARAGYTQVFKEGFVRDYALEIRHRDGRITPVLYNASVYEDESGKVIGVFAAARDITERKKAERELRTASLYARSLIEASLDPLVTIDPEGRISDVNAATELVTGYSREELIGTDFSSYFTSPDVASAGYMQVFKEGFVRDYALEIRHRDGHVIPVLYNASVYRDESGKVIGVFAAARDITERKKAERELRTASLYARSLIEASLDPLVTIDPEGRVSDVNAATELVTGYSREELIGTDFSSYFTEPDLARAGYTLVFKEGFVRDYALEIRHRDGRITPVLYNASVYRDESGKVIGVFAAARDITERKKAERELNAAMLYARSLIEASLDPLVTISADGKVMDVNKATEEVTGVPRKNLIGSDFSDYFTEPSKAQAGYEKVFREGFVKDYPLAIRHTSGRITEVLYNATTYRNEDGEVQGVFAAARDVSELRRAQEALQKSHDELEHRVEERTVELRDREERLTHALEAGELGTWDLNTKTGKVWRSLRHDQIFGYEMLLPEWTYRMLLDHVLPEDRKEVNEKYGHALSTGTEWSFECRIQRADGAVRWIWAQGKPRLNERGEVVRMVGLIRDVTETAANNWIKTGISRIEEAMHGDPHLQTICERVIAEIARYLGAQVGAFYLLSERDKTLYLASGYAYMRPKSHPEKFGLSEGLIGQAAMGKQEFLINDIPDEYIKVTSALGNAKPRALFVMPLVHEDHVKGVIEIGSLGQLTDFQLDYLRRAMRIVAINVEAAQNRESLALALSESQALAEELQMQHEEQKTTNEALEEQTQRLSHSERKLKEQQEELQSANKELREINESLEQQKHEVEQANRDLNAMRRDLEDKAEQLSIASQYKSEFLANMSHELRTPLNSILLLAKLLADNREGVLNDEQVESAGIIYKSGNDLLALIDDILDLSKIEVGRMELSPDRIPVQSIADGLRTGFGHLAEERGLELEIVVNKDCPESIVTDKKRANQILRNLMSNALKFTDEGGIYVEFLHPDGEAEFPASGLTCQNSLAIKVRDTGIGIPKEKQEIVFEAFQQADKGTARKYGGTGLGLSISRELAVLLGGEIHLESEPGKGSSFTLYLPLEMKKPGSSKKPDVPAGKGMPQASKPAPLNFQLTDDRDNLVKVDKVILIIEDDLQFAGLLKKECHEKGFKCLAAATGEEGLELAKKHNPSAVILDLRLPGIDGWTVLAALKDSPKTRHIPVHIISIENETIQAFRKGAVGFLTKPVKKSDLDEVFRKLESTFSKRVKDLLVVEDDSRLRKSIVKLIGNSDVRAEEASTGEETIHILKSKPFDCMILDIGLPDMSGFDLLEKLEAMDDVSVPPVVVYTGRELSREQENLLHEHSESIIIKGVRSEERLLDEVSLFLHRMVDRMPEKKRKVIANLYDTDTMFKDKTVLVVDDDMRNAFALSKVLSERGMKLLKAENGQKALEILRKEDRIDLVLMDIMMPVMDGYEAMKRIRKQERFAKLPVIALTAKAMKEDRQRCIEAGASDYLPKPVDISRLLSVMRIWLYR